MLAKARHFMRKRELLSLYCAIFASHLSYACQVWSSQVWFIHNSVSNKISNMQKKAMRIISFSEFHAPPDPLFKLNRVLKIQDLVSLQNCLFVHDFLNGKLPTCFNDYFTLVTDVHELRG